jgi:hypothetical protein
MQFEGLAPQSVGVPGVTPGSSAEPISGSVSWTCR